MILIQARRDDCLEMLNLMRKRDISKEPFDEIIWLFQRYSRGFSKNKVGTWDTSSKTIKSTNDGVIRVDIGSLFENFKIHIISLLSSQLDVLQGK